MNQIQKSLPASEWQKVAVQENNEPVVEMQKTDRIKLGWVKKSYEPEFRVRRTVSKKLVEASQYLPKGYVLVMVEGVRSLEKQRQNWNSKWEHLKRENPDWSDEELDKAVRLVTARPLPLANHNCGGAVDVVLGREDGTLVDMGTPYPSTSMDASWHKKFMMLSSDITDEQKANRTILRNAMESAGFVWYPGEWWHYCYGDRMWAVYTGRTECFYGPLSY